MASARDIYQIHLDAVTDALWERDFDRCLDLFTLPHRRRLGTRDVLIEAKAALLAEGRAFRDTLDGLGATGFIRICRAGAFVGDDRIEGEHESYVVRGGTYQVQPYLVQLKLLLSGGLWRAAECHVPNFPIPLSGYPEAAPGRPTTDEDIR